MQMTACRTADCLAEAAVTGGVTLTQPQTQVLPVVEGNMSLEDKHAAGTAVASEAAWAWLFNCRSYFAAEQGL